MNLESSQGITEGEVKARTYPFNDPKVLAKAKRRAKAWRKKNPEKWAQMIAANRTRALAKIQAKRAKKNQKQARKTATTLKRPEYTAIGIKADTKARFDTFRNGSTVDFALNILLNTVKGKKLVAKPVAVEYTVE